MTPLDLWVSQGVFVPMLFRGPECYYSIASLRHAEEGFTEITLDGHTAVIRIPSKRELSLFNGYPILT